LVADFVFPHGHGDPADTSPVFGLDFLIQGDKFHPVLCRQLAGKTDPIASDEAGDKNDILIHTNDYIIKTIVLHGKLL